MRSRNLTTRRQWRIWTEFGVTGICPVVHVEDEGFEKLCQDVAGYIDRVYPDKNF